MKIFFKAALPAGLEQAWLQHVRDFDVAHPGCHFEVMFDGPDIAAEDAIRMMQVNPSLTFSAIFERERKE